MRQEVENRRYRHCDGCVPERRGLPVDLRTDQQKLRNLNHLLQLASPQ
jgi:hypothetical protein